MNSIVSDIIAFVDDSNATPESLIVAHNTIGRRALRIVCIKLAGWWRRERLQGSRHRYLSLNVAHEWCRNLNVVLTTVPELANILALTEGRCGFVPSVNPDDVAEINSYARDHYNPIVLR